MKKIIIAFVAVLVLGVAAVGGAYQYINNQLYSRVEGEYFDSDGVNIHYTVEGEGPPVILVHGFSVNADIQWRMKNTIDMLATDYTVVALDNRGHGLSDKPYEPEAYGDEFANDVIRLMDHLGYEKAAVVGYSMGGMITFRIAEKYPERLVCAAPCGFGWAPDEELQPEFAEQLATSLESGGGFRPLFEALQPEGEAPNEAVFNTMNTVLSKLNDEKALAALVRSWITIKPDQSALEKNEVPLLSIVGSVDPLHLGAQHMQNYTKNLEVHLIDGRNHMDALDGTEFNETLKAFIDEHYQAASDVDMPAAA